MDTPVNISENKVKLTDEERANLECRTKILVDEAKEAFNHFLSSIDSLNNRISTLFQIFLVLISIEVVIFTPYFQNGTTIFSPYSRYLFCFLFFLVILFSLISFGLLIYLLLPRSMRDVSIFEEKRFIELCNLDSVELLSDSLYQMKESYQFVVPIYIRRVNWFFYAYTSVISMTICYIILIISLKIC
jgi:hypothetical protein